MMLQMQHTATKTIRLESDGSRLKNILFVVIS